MEKREQNIQNERIVSSSSAGLFYTVTILCYIVISIFFSIIATMLFKDPNSSSQDGYMYFSYSLAGVSLILTVIIGTKIAGDNFKDYLGQVKVKPHFYLIAILIFFGLVFGLGEVNNYFIEFLEKIGYTKTNSTLPSKNALSVIVCTFLVCLVPAVLEELIFRGVLLNGLKKHGEVLAIVISSVAFSFYHMSPEKTIYQFLAGVFFSVLALKSNSILPSCLAHFLNNFFVVINYYFLGLSFLGALKIVFIVLGLIALFVGLFALCFKQKFAKGDKNGLGEFFVAGLGGIIGAFAFWIMGLF